MNGLRICLMGFGEVGQILAEDLTGNVRALSVYDTLFSDPRSGPSKAASRYGLQPAASAAEAAKNADLVFCAVTAANDIAAAQSVVPGVKRDALYADFNSASPESKIKAADLIEAAGGRYVECAVMSPFPPKRLASRMLLGGPHAEEFRIVTEQLGFRGEVFSEKLGKASATKMCRSVMIKGIEALLVESMLSARHYGVENVVLESLSDLLPIGDWPKLARYMISRALEHGTRRAEEMYEVAQTVGDAGLLPLMSKAAAELQSWAAGYRSVLDEDSLPALLDKMLSQISSEKT